MTPPPLIQSQIDRIVRESEWTVEDWMDFHNAVEAVKRKIAERHWKPSPAGRCDNCGETWFYNGAWKKHRFEQQAEAFKQKHANCLPTADGGCI